MPPIERDEKKVAYKRGKRRVAAKQPSPAQCLEWLSRSNLHGVLCRNAVWLACTRQLAYFLERVCLGRRAPPEAGPVVFHTILIHFDCFLIHFHPKLIVLGSKLIVFGRTRNLMFDCLMGGKKDLLLACICNHKHRAPLWFPAPLQTGL